jgi:hypothetical protein
MGLPQLTDFGLDEAAGEAVRRQEGRRRRAFTWIMAWGSATIWVAWSAGLYFLWLRTGALSRLALALLFGLVAAALAAVPLSVVAAIACSLFWPRHPQADQLDRYEKARGNVRPCDVCIMTVGDASPKADVHYCPRCGAWICAECRPRYDLRAIAALKRRVLSQRPRA